MTSIGVVSDKKLDRPIRVGLVGAGYAARGFALQCLRGHGPELVFVVNRTPDRARKMLADLDASPSVPVSDSIDELLRGGKIDAVVEATGDVEYGASVAVKVITAKKHLIEINAELDGTIGPILKIYADNAGVVYTQADGDQPAAIVNLAREAERFGLTPVVGGNIKTFFDRHRTPDTQKEWAHQNGQSLTLATGAVDGTKLSFEMATVANALRFTVAKSGMHGFRVTRVEGASDVISRVLPESGGIVEYILGAAPPFGVFVIATTKDPVLQEYLRQYKMGDGPLYTLYRPYHLCTLEAHTSVFDAVKFHKATIAPAGQYCEVIAVAKKTLETGEILDGIGGYCTYGQIENSDTVRSSRFLPIGLSRGCMLKRSVQIDQPITFDDVDLPPGRQIDLLYAEQRKIFV